MVTGLEGTFKDFKNNWSCGSLPEWIEHLGEVELTYKGTGLCPTCGDSLTYEWTGKLRNGKTYPEPLCEGCKTQ